MLKIEILGGLWQENCRIFMWIIPAALPYTNAYNNPKQQTPITCSVSGSQKLVCRWRSRQWLTYCVSALRYGSRMTNVSFLFNRSDHCEPSFLLLQELDQTGKRFGRSSSDQGVYHSEFPYALAPTQVCCKELQTNFEFIQWHARAFLEAWPSCQMKMFLLLKAFILLDFRL